MPQVPDQPTIYHITHVDNLPAIMASGRLYSDQQMIQQGGPSVAIGMSQIKQRRLSMTVTCHPGDTVGDYVPFYFCPRSVMLYLLYRGNHPQLSYTGGQEPIVHLEADLVDVIDWAKHTNTRWAFTLSNAATRYVQFRSRPEDLGDIDWQAVSARDWQDPDIREGKQAEFLVHDAFPFELVNRIGVSSATIAVKVKAVLAGAKHKASVLVIPDWYY